MVSSDVFPAIGCIEEVVTEEAHGFEFVDEFDDVAVGESGLEMGGMRSVSSRRNGMMERMGNWITHLGLFLLGLLEP